MTSFYRVDDEMKQILVQSGQPELNKSLDALNVLAKAAEISIQHALYPSLFIEQGNDGSFVSKALEVPLRPGVLPGDVVTSIFEPAPLEPGASPEFPIDWLAPGTEKEYVAYTLPAQGKLPQAMIAGSYVTIHTYEFGHAIAWLKKYARDARWDIVSRAREVLLAGMVQKMNNDGWTVLLGAAVDRNIVVYDADANSGQFTKRLINILGTAMRRNGGGNSATPNRIRLTDLYISPEAKEDIMNWDLSEISEASRQKLEFFDEDTFVIGNYRFHVMDEFGEGQPFQKLYENELGGSLPTGDKEILVGLSSTGKGRSFVHPIREMVSVVPDTQVDNLRQAGFAALAESGWGVLDNRYVILGSF